LAMTKVRKTIPTALMDALRKAASSTAVTLPNFASGNGKAFEAWVLFETALALKPEYNVLPVDHVGGPTRHFRVRGGPGYLSLLTSSASDEPCHFRVSNSRMSMELHSGIRHLGASGADHEIDVSLVYQADAQSCRSLALRGPFKGVPWAGFELKDYDPGAYLPKGYARALIGVGMEMNPFSMLPTVQVAMGGRVGLAVNRDPRPRLSLITSARLRPSAPMMLRHYDIGCAQQLMPGSPRSVRNCLRMALGL
jgi:hypothetical protein